MAPVRSGNTDGGQDSADHFAPSSHCPSWSSTPAFSGRPSDTENAALEVSGARGGDGQGMEAAENHADARARALGTHSRALPGDAGGAVNDNGPLRAEPGGGGRCRRQTQQCSVLCATAVIFALLAERELPETGKSHRCGGEADIVGGRGNDAAVNQRRIMLRGGTFIDTRCTPNLRGCARQPGATHEDSEAWGSLPNRRRWLRQWYVQTRTVLTAGQHAELEAASGVKLGPYFPHNAYLIVATFDRACRVSRSRHVAWVGERQASHKLDESILDMNRREASAEAAQSSGAGSGRAPGIGSISVALNVMLWPHMHTGSTASTSDWLGKQLLEGIMNEFAVNSSVRAPGSDKLVVETTTDQMHQIAEWLGQDASVVAVERKTKFAARNDASNRILLSGSSAASTRDSTAFAKSGLNGSGVVVGVADTGLDFDHCMLWQQPFPWFCFDPYPSLKPGVEAERALRCPLSAYAGLLAKPDFRSFLSMMLESNTLGLKWENVGTSQPSGAQLALTKNTAVLDAHLKLGKTNFTLEEWRTFAIPDLRPFHFMKVTLPTGSAFFKPVSNPSVPMMDSGGTRSASSKPIPLDVEWQRQWQRQIKGTSDEVTFPNARAYRASKSAKNSGFCLGCGLDFNYSFQGTITNVPHGLGAQIGLLGLLKTWSQVRQPLLEALTADTPCADCGGKVRIEQGVQVFTSRKPYSFDKDDTSWDYVNKKVGRKWRIFEKLLSEKCFCFWTTSNTATIDPDEVWQGPIPAVRQMIEMKSSAQASIVRKGLGLSALPVELLQGLCSATRGGPVKTSMERKEEIKTSYCTGSQDLLQGLRPGCFEPGCTAVSCSPMPPETQSWGLFPEPSYERDEDGVRTEICENNVTITWEGKNITYGPCDLQWDPRLVESALARCVAGAYLQDSDYLRKRADDKDPYQYDELSSPPVISTFRIEDRDKIDAADLEAEQTALSFGRPVPPKTFVLNLKGNLDVSYKGKAVYPMKGTLFQRAPQNEGEQLAFTYAYNTTLEWWKEYTTLPPFEHHDMSRRKVHSYYTYKGCEPCGMCARLRLDTRNFENVIVSSKLPAALLGSKNHFFYMHLKPEDFDWRLDSWEARNIGFSAELDIRRTFTSHIYSANEDLDVGFCVLTESQYAAADDVQSKKFWVDNCINLGGRVFGTNNASGILSTAKEEVVSARTKRVLVEAALRDDGLRRDDHLADHIAAESSWAAREISLCFQEMLSYAQCKAFCSKFSCKHGALQPMQAGQQLAAGGTVFQRVERIARLPPSADGWRVLAWNNGTSDVKFDVVLRIYTIPVSCSDKMDGASQIAENTHSLNLGHQNVKSLLPKDQCLKDNRTYCDGTTHTGRQLDLCGVCGGSCFKPSCTRAHCYAKLSTQQGVKANRDQDKKHHVRIRYIGDVEVNPTGQQSISKIFKLSQGEACLQEAIRSSELDFSLPCPSPSEEDPTDPVITTAGRDCNCKKTNGGRECSNIYECNERIETYDIDTGMQNVKAGVPFVFTTGRLVFESNFDPALARMVRMRILALTDPLMHLRTGVTFNGTKGGGEIKLSDKFQRMEYGGRKYIVHKGMNITGRVESRENSAEDVESEDTVIENYCASWRVGCVTEHPNEIEVVMNETYIPDFLDGLSYTPSEDSGTTLQNRQKMIRIQIQFLQQNMKVWPSFTRVDKGYEGGKDITSPGTCKAGFASMHKSKPIFFEACDTIYPPFELRFTVEPVDAGQRIIHPDDVEGLAGRKQILSRDGHGTHVITSIVGRAMEAPSSTAEPTTWLEYTKERDAAIAKTSAQIGQYEGLANGAFLSFVDIGKSGHPYLTPPESLGDSLFGRSYTEGGARVFLNPWTCEDFVWWKKQDQPFDLEQEVAATMALNKQPSICNRYGIDAWEVDDFVARHPDLLVVFPAGDNGAGGMNTVSSPGTCKNCLTVGTSQSWPDSLEESIQFQLSQCRDVDCPQDFDKTNSCADPSATSPFSIPACCKKYSAGYRNFSYGPWNIDPRSSRGDAVKEQAPFSDRGGDSYKDMTKLKFGRIKPDVVAPGINIVSGRSDGNPESLGTDPLGGVNHAARAVTNPLLGQGPERCGLDNKKDAKDRACLTTMSGSSMAAAKVAALAVIVHQYYAQGYYPGGKGGYGQNFPPSAAIVRATIIASADIMHTSVTIDANTVDANNIRSLPTPNSHAGFGIPRLSNVLRIDEESAASGEGVKTKMAVFDHQIVNMNQMANGKNCSQLAASSRCKYATFKKSLNPVRGALSQNESVTYTLRITKATPEQPFVAAMAYTDPVGVLGSSTVLVNDLDLKVSITPLVGDPCISSCENPTAHLKRNETKRTAYFGNGNRSIAGGDPDNNAEVVRITRAGPSEVEVTVFAKRVVSGFPGSDGKCQPFALITSGLIDLDLQSNPVPISTAPKNLQLGVCGRAPLMPALSSEGLTVLQIALIVVGSVIGALMIIFLCYKLGHKIAVDRFRKRMNTSKPDVLGYVSKLEKMHVEEGVARGGDLDHIILAASASAEHGFYEGLPIQIIAGKGQGETGIITEYDGRTKRADVDFECDVGPGSKYSISHDKGLGMGYKIGEAGYMPVGHLPQPDDKARGPMYSKQFEAQARARSVHGGLEDDDLDAIGIGRKKQALSKREKVQRLHAGRRVGEAVSSADLYRSAVSKGHEDQEGGYQEPAPILQYADAKARDLALEEGSFYNPDGLRGRNVHTAGKGTLARAAPPLKHSKGSATKRGFLAVPGFTSAQRDNRSGLSKFGENLKWNAKTWESEGIGAFQLCFLLSCVKLECACF